MRKKCEELGKGVTRSATWQQALRRFGIGLAGVALVCGRATIAWADWTPPESGVTPPAVLTLDVFAAPDWTGAYPDAALVLGPDGALYGSAYSGGTSGNGTLFRVETNGTFTKLHDFNSTDGANPEAALVLGPDGALYGSTYGGGTNGYGTLFRLETNGTFTKLHDFNGTDGSGPVAAMVVGPDGALYGSTEYGGTNYYYGTLFRVDTNGAFASLHDFNGFDGWYPSAPLAVGPDGALYGTTYNSGNYGAGTLFRAEINGNITLLYHFDGSNGANPSAALVVGPDGALYGSTYSGGASGNGTLFRLETNGIAAKLHDFNGTDGSGPSAALVVGPDGVLYGSTYGGGVSSNGTLFRVDTDGSFANVHDFSGTDGSGPAAGLVAGPDGALYGSASGGGTNGSPYGSYGTLFRLQADGTFTKLHDFTFADGDGDSPVTAMVVGPDGALYAPASYGGDGAPSSGTLFRLQTDGIFTKLHDFNGTDGISPSAALVVGPDGALYGSTQNGGANGYYDYYSGYYYGYGTLFRVATDGTFTRLHDFNGTDGDQTSAALIVGPDGALYGSTQYGGTFNGGTLFRLETNGTFTKVHDFNGADGADPSAALVMGPDGALYGSTYNAGINGYGALFRLETNGAFTKLHDFDGTDGANPTTAMVVGPDAALYGSTYYGGTNDYGDGTLFRLETNGTFTKLHDFNRYDGQSPSAPLVVGRDGALYGSTSSGGANPNGPLGGYGTLFRLETNGTFTILGPFDGTDGYQPSTALVVGPEGALYGSTYGGGTNGYGTLFRLQTDGSFTKLHDFSGSDGDYPDAALELGPDGVLYGSTQFGGTNNNGTLFRVQANGTFAKLYEFRGTNGANPSTPLVVGPDGALYGSTPNDGPRGGGILFKVVLDRPPVARCHDVTAPAGPNCAAVASVDNGSFDPDAGDTITLRQEPPGPYPVGATRVTLTVTDNHGASDSCSATVTVVDTTPPTISDLTVTPNVLWPPNSKMVEVTVNYTATDSCGAVSRALSVASNEAPDGSGHGGTTDWVIKDSHHVLLRAERSGKGTGRIYAISVVATDSAGNRSTKTVTVTVPKSRGK
jgi:uncharacterized repeat protein (TIGR03803 family)